MSETLLAERAADHPVLFRDMANAIRALAMDAVEKARSGHPGMPMGMADVASVLFMKYLNIDPAYPAWPDRDRVARHGPWTFPRGSGRNPGFRSRIAHHIEFPDYTDEELLRIAESMLARQEYAFDVSGREAMRDYIAARKTLPHFANARSIRNALDRARLRHANRLFEAQGGPIDAGQLSTIKDIDIRSSRVFGGGLAHERSDRA